jgi:peroxiredoxin
MTMLLLALAFPWLLIGFGCWFCYQLARQNGRILLRLEALEKRLEARDAEPPQPGASPPAGLPVGSIAPEFELPDLAGTRRRLSNFRGRRVLLIFFNPNCGFCTGMAPELAALATEGGDSQPMPLVVTTGDREANRRLFEAQAIGCPVLLQQAMEVATAYQAYGTPTGYLIDEAGAIASNLAGGAPALLALGTARSPAPEQRHALPKPIARGNRPVTESRLNRSGLKAGTPAPGFRLPRLDGGELALDDYRGRRVLLVFSDPGCGPCDRLAPQLERLHRERQDLQVLMISRQDLETNRQKAAKLGLTFPVALQKNWEVSLRYAMFVTPMSYLINERGVLASDVAVGVEPILALAARPSVSTNGQRPSHPVLPWGFGPETPFAAPP